MASLYSRASDADHLGRHFTFKIEAGVMNALFHEIFDNKNLSSDEVIAASNYQ